MLDRVLKLIVVLTLLLFFLKSVIGVLSRVLEAALMGAVSAIGNVGSLVWSLMAAVVVACLFVGFAVRFVQFVATRDPRAARERASRERAMRQRVRRPAEGVPPLNNHREPLADSDPAIGQDEEER